MSESARRAHVLVMGTADWDQTIATNQHYMVRELARQFDVTFVESLGLRRPELSRRDFRRALNRLTGSKGSPTTKRPVPDNVEVLSPKVVPIHTRPWSALNLRLLTRTLRSWCSGESKKIFWSYSPVTYGFDRMGAVAVYHCVDLYGTLPGIDSALIDMSEKRLARAGVRAIGSSRVVVDHLTAQGFKDVLYWPNVADTEVIARAAARTDTGRSGALFAGNLTDVKVDFELLKRLLASGVELHLAGPIAEGGGDTRAILDELVAAGAKYHGVLDLPALSSLMVQCKVGLIPYLINPYTRGVSPLKTYEYLAAGLAVVSTALPGVDEVADHVRVAASPEGFALNVTSFLTDEVDHVHARTQIAELHSWTQRGADARSLLGTLLSGAEVDQRQLGMTEGQRPVV